MKYHGEKNRTKHKEDELLNIYTTENLLSFPTKVNNNTKSKTKKYELFNLVSETKDSIYNIIASLEDLSMTTAVKEYEGHVYISLSEIRKIVNEELKQRLGPSSLNNKKNE